MEHFCEVGRDTGLRALNPYWSMLKILEQSDRIELMLAYDEDVIIGYCLGLYVVSLQNKEQTRLVSNSIFVEAAYRRRGVGLQLVRCMQDIAARADAECVWHAPSHSKLDQLLSRRPDYTASHTIYRRRHDRSD